MNLTTIRPDKTATPIVRYRDDANGKRHTLTVEFETFVQRPDNAQPFLEMTQIVIDLTTQQMADLIGMLQNLVAPEVETVNG